MEGTPIPGIYRETGRHGPYDQGLPIWKGAVVVACGDLVYDDPTDVTVAGDFIGGAYTKPAALFTWTTDLATTQGLFKDLFRGVSMARRTAAQTADGGRGDGMIIETGEFCFPCAALGAAALVGALVGPAKQSGNFLESQKVAIASVNAGAIGILTEPAPVGATFLTFKIVPGLASGRGLQVVL